MGDWLVESGQYDVNKMYDVNGSSFSIFQYSINKALPDVALKIMKGYSVDVLKKDGKGRTVLEYWHPRILSDAERFQWSELDQKIQRRKFAQEYSKRKEEEALVQENLKRKRENSEQEKERKTEEKSEATKSELYSLEFLERNWRHKK